DIIDINYTDKANFVHEVTHAGQFESGDIVFSKENGNPALTDLVDETYAYKSQYAYNPSSIIGLNPQMSVNSINSINCTWVSGIVYNGKMIYSMGDDNKTAQGSVGINSPAFILPIVYPTIHSLLYFIGSSNLVRHVTNYHVKR
ncbi:MAG: hypothetical protein NC095_08390, partial [Muribaculum sp.]|nr:hypothetical protein [Muribaculum sp.]